MVLSSSADPFAGAALLLGMSWIAWIAWIKSLFEKKTADDFTTPTRRMFVPIFLTLFAVAGSQFSEDNTLHNVVAVTLVLAVVIIICAILVSIFKRVTRAIAKKRGVDETKELHVRASAEESARNDES
jgi:TRAP-type C4-dicarboxylate transport system permease small subunit